ncbi:MAG TPA: hypothetical protein DIT48_11530 [Actinobacteria bacterium]|nr:hypothetical protein [Actinomycetota bacterium]
MVGGPGKDLVDYNDQPGDTQCSVDVDLSTGIGRGPCFGTDHLTSIEDIDGSSGADHLVGDAGANFITDEGGAGDQVFGMGGDDSLQGHSDGDSADGGPGRR